jgi:P27 family predicted phage terminase small subunit
MPEWLSADARQVWHRTVAELTAMGMAHAADSDALVVYCAAVVTHAKAQQLLDAAGPLIKGHDGGVVRNPACTIVNHCAVIIGRYAREFGLTPSARVNLAHPAPDPEGTRVLAGRLLS